MMKRKKRFPVSPKKCLSTHGGAGYVAGSYWDNGAIVCGACGTRIEKPAPTGGYKDVPTYPDWIAGIPQDKTSEGLREIERLKKRWWEFWK